MFLASVDYAEGFERQNPLGAVEAFCRAFSDGEGPLLMLETAHASRYPLEHAMLLKAAGARRDIEILECANGATGRFIYDWKPERACFVSLHRSEGTGLALARAMSCGMASMVTAHSCGAELLSERDSYQVGWTNEKILERVSYSVSGEYWAQPDLDQASLLMRLVASDNKLLRFKARKSRERAQKLFSTSSVRSMRERLALIEKLFYSSELSGENKTARAVSSAN